ncbi:NAD(P) transhydrogenase, beta subunit, partial [mine drainage metagenome]
GPVSLVVSVSVVFAVVIGAVSFAGSGIAYAKLQEMMRGTPITYPGQQPVNGAVAAAIVVLGVLIVVSGIGIIGLWGLLLLALVLGVAFVLPIGGADMPVVISMLNAFTGLAVAGDGFVLGNPVLIVGGTLVGASGTFLTK